MAKGTFEWRKHVLERLAELGISQASSADSSCPICGGQKQAGKTTHSVELGFGVVVVRNVPAMLCSLCGEEWISNETALELERVMNEAKATRLQVEVLAL